MSPTFSVAGLLLQAVISVFDPLRIISGKTSPLSSFPHTQGSECLGHSEKTFFGFGLSFTLVGHGGGLFSSLLVVFSCVPWAWPGLWGRLTCPGTMNRNTNTEQQAPLQDTPDRAPAKGRAFKVLLVVEVAGKHLGINGQAEGFRPQSKGWGQDGKGR